MIRLATDNDIEEILSIFNDAIINTTSIYAYTPQTIEERKIWYKKKVTIIIRF
ncbi:MAG: GNAT family N-acetyltransferase [Eubacteriaceae bacterium]